MATSPTASVIEHLRGAVLLREATGPGDAELLGRFVERRDEAALAALVRRHGPMVWGVCRRLVGYHDAEDAFQATFLVLVRKAASIAPREMVGNWLYGVAHQAALQARRTAARRRAREVQVTQMPDTETVQPDPWSDVQSVLDQELSRLPDNYRVVIVLCDLEGRTRKEVARQLEVPEGTVAGRLARARVMLAKRLTRRGVALSGGALATVLTQNVASAGVPASVVSSTIQATTLMTVGPTVPTGAIPVKVAALAEGVLKAMLMSKLKAAVAVVLVLGLLATGAMGLGYHKAAAQGDKPPVAKEPVQVPQKDKKNATPPAKEISDLEGEWVVVAMEGDGEEATADDVKGMKWVVKGNEITASQPGLTGKMSFKLDPKKTPKEIDVTALDGDLKGTTSPGIYSLEGQRLCVCFGEKVRPKKFATAPGGGLTMLTLEKEIPTAWGKEVDGLQAGLALVPAIAHRLRPGETVNLEVKLRNVGKADVTVTHGLLHESPPTITDTRGGHVSVTLPPILGIIVIPTERVIKPGETVTLYYPEVEVAESLLGQIGPEPPVGTPTIRVRPGKYKIAFGGMVHSHPTLSTGTTEFEVQEPVKPVAATEEVFTAWGKEVNGLQAGLGFPTGQKRAYHHGETVTLVVRVRNVGKEAVKFEYIRQFLDENRPTVTDAGGKTTPQSTTGVTGVIHVPVEVTLEPGKEVVLESRFHGASGWPHELVPARGGGTPKTKDWPLVVGTGKVGLQYERVFGNSSIGRIKLDPALEKLATGMLELEVKPEPPAAAAPAAESPEEKVKKLKLVEVFTNKTSYTTKPTPDAPRPPVIHFFWGKKNEVRVAPGQSALVELPKSVTEISWNIPGYVPDGAGSEDGPEFDFVYCKWEKDGKVTLTMYKKP
jgi:RNA polymerase sigma factor (sigma-70 family)